MNFYLIPKVNENNSSIYLTVKNIASTEDHPIKNLTIKR